VTQPAAGVLVLTSDAPSLLSGVFVIQPDAGILRLTADAPTLTGADPPAASSAWAFINPLTFLRRRR
jgi:hypothetical protein